MALCCNCQRLRIVLALGAVFPILAPAEEVDAQIRPDLAEVTLKLPYQDSVNPLFGQYDGVRQPGLNGSLALDLIKRNEAGEWFRIKGIDLGLRTQELSVTYEKQGSWLVALDYNQIPRYAPYTVHSAVAGSGTNVLRQPSYAGSTFSGSGIFRSDPPLAEVTLHTERDITTLTAGASPLDGLRFGLSFRNEDKTGIRMDGVRGAAPTAPLAQKNIYGGFLFAPEPINQNHQQFEATIDYEQAAYQLAAGYYGSFLSTRHDALFITPGTNTGLVAADLSPVGLPPDNSAQQIYFSGAYNFSAETRGSLKIVDSVGEQRADFLAGQAALPSVGSGLRGRVRTRESFASLSSRLGRDLKLLATWRHENKDDQTPRRLTVLPGIDNNPESHVANWGKLEADYTLGGGYALSAGFDHTQKRSREWDRRQVAESTWRLALRKAMGESVNGSLSVAHAERTGSAWDSASNAVVGRQYPVYLADRRRDRVRGLVDWLPTEELSIQIAYEADVDDYRKNTYGLDKGSGQVVSLDASYAVDERWKLNAWYSQQRGSARQYMQGGACTSADCLAKTARNSPYIQWNAQLDARSEQFGFAITGRIRTFDVGAQYLHARERNDQQVSPLAGQRTCTALAGTNCTTYGTVVSEMGLLPGTLYAQDTLKLFVAHALGKGTRLRLDYIHDRRKIDDYTWTQWIYADGTRVFVRPEQTTQLIALSLTQSF